MIIYNFDIESITFVEYKANSPLIIDTDRMLACPITPQRLEPVSWRYAKILQDTRTIEDPQFS